MSINKILKKSKIKIGVNKHEEIIIFTNKFRYFLEKNLKKLKLDIKIFLLDEVKFLEKCAEGDIEKICAQVKDITNTDVIWKAWAYAQKQITKEIFLSDAITYKNLFNMVREERQEFVNKIANKDVFMVRTKSDRQPQCITATEMLSDRRYFNTYKPLKFDNPRPVEEQGTPVPYPFEYYEFTQIETDKKCPDRVLIIGRKKNNSFTKITIERSKIDQFIELLKQFK